MRRRPSPPIEPPRRACGFPIRGARRRTGWSRSGCDFNPGTLLLAYRSGIFPWPHGEDERRATARRSCSGSRPSRAASSRSRPSRTGRAACAARCASIPYEVTRRRGLPAVMQLCGETRAKRTWIIPELVAGYVKLHELGWAHSVEVWETAPASGARARRRDLRRRDRRAVRRRVDVPSADGRLEDRVRDRSSRSCVRRASRSSTCRSRTRTSSRSAASRSRAREYLARLRAALRARSPAPTLVMTAARARSEPRLARSDDVKVAGARAPPPERRALHRRIDAAQPSCRASSDFGPSASDVPHFDRQPNSGDSACLCTGELTWASATARAAAPPTLERSSEVSEERVRSPNVLLEVLCWSDCLEEVH